MHKSWRRFAFKNTLLLALSVVLFFLLAETPFVENLIEKAGNFGYVGAFVAGIFFVSTFTVAPAAVVLFRLAEHLSVWEVALLAGVGGVVGDYIIFRFTKDTVYKELSPTFRKRQFSGIKKLFRRRQVSWVIPVLGAVIVASPLPDEIGISMLGMSKINAVQFFALVFSLNTLGIFAVITIAQL